VQAPDGQLVDGSFTHRMLYSRFEVAYSPVTSYLAEGSLRGDCRPPYLTGRSYLVLQALPSARPIPLLKAGNTPIPINCLRLSPTGRGYRLLPPTRGELVLFLLLFFLFRPM